MTKAEAGRLGGLAGDPHEKCARMREGRKKKIRELEAKRDEAEAARERCWQGWGETLEVAARLRSERDEARQVARDLLRIIRSKGDGVMGLPGWVRADD